MAEVGWQQAKVNELAAERDSIVQQLVQFKKLAAQDDDKRVEPGHSGETQSDPTASDDHKNSQ